MINILVLPHTVPHKKLKARTLEIAKELSRDNSLKVYVVERNPLKEDLIYGLKNLFKKRSIKGYVRDSMFFLKVPYIPALIEPFLSYNKLMLSNLIKELNIHVIINSFNHSFSIEPSRQYAYIYDLADDYVNFHQNPFIKKLMEKFIKKEVVKCDLLTVVATTLGEGIVQKGWKKTYMWLISGLDLEPFQKISWEKINSLREKFNLQNKFVIGDIGFHDKKGGTEFAIKAILAARKVDTSLTLLVVGAGPEIKRLKKRYSNEESVIFTGPVSPEDVPAYFLITDVGILPYEDHPSVHGRFPLRLLDFIAAKKLVITWPFGDLKSLKIPNVILAERKVEEWAEAILKAKEMKWEPEWDYLHEEFSSRKIINTFREKIFEILEEKKIRY